MNKYQINFSLPYTVGVKETLIIPSKLTKEEIQKEYMDFLTQSYYITSIENLTIKISERVYYDDRFGGEEEFVDSDFQCATIEGQLNGVDIFIGTIEEISEENAIKRLMKNSCKTLTSLKNKSLKMGTPKFTINSY